jgi:hypothetical protein
MRTWLREVWADRPARIALVLAALVTIPAWFVWPGEPVMEAIDALVIAGFLATFWIRDLLGARGALVAIGIVVAIAGLVLEAVFYTASDDRPLMVALIFPAGLVLMLAAGVAQRSSS